MPTVKPISREYRIYLALWRKALKSDIPVSFKCSNYAMAIAIRQGMYRAIKPFRYGEAADQELKEASEKFVCYLIKNMDGEKHLTSQPHWIELRPRATLAEMDSMLLELEIEEDDLFVGEERGLSEKLKKLVKEGAPVPARKTQFYERD